MKLTNTPAAKNGGLFVGYVLACWATRLVFITMAAYFLISTTSPVQDMGDVVRANGVQTFGLAAMLYITALQFLYPLTSTTWRDVLPRQDLRTYFPTGMATGAVLSAAMLVGATLGGYYSILGFYTKIDELVVALVANLFFLSCLFALCVVEEYVLRGRIEPYLQGLLSRERVPVHLRKPAAAVGVMVLFVLLKNLQFDLEPLEALNMMLLSFCLSRAKADTGSHLASAGFAAGLFAFSHSLCSLPLFGQDVAGMVLVRATEEKGLGTLLAGGPQGPENGLLLTLLLGLFVFQKKFKLKDAMKTILAASFLTFLSVTASAAPGASTVTASNLNTLDLVLQAGFMAKLVLLSLFIASVFSWTIIVTKSATLKAATKTNQAFLKIFWQGQDLEEIYIKSEQFNRAPVSHVFKAGYKELKKLTQTQGKPGVLLQTASLENVNRSLNRAMVQELTQLESRVGFLATIAACAPFVGLFGTVWGIMNSFQGIGATGNANLAVVAPGISEALIATAAGLGAAIPAVIAYNHFNQKIRNLGSNMDAFSLDFLNLVQRNLLKGSE